ncbi:LPXTG cell wall anchor domain-containing protein [Staphylococcus pasteuri]|uniref:LPXTG cell wall anchor domain-containing protein n=1 Tax=Staphylococcus TaxID=1279 RepID=UPI00048B4A57|nr:MULTISPECIES: LPXTG cell wall anchor domain-containing protein [Staphylococcus]ODB53959.1 hypothetical protein A9N02_08680 [Staphylococcus sp. AOAB]RQX28389.1 LPXTG cell wall anchor domain-containing protein [Staphylococcus warneri]MBL3398957.1 LPXTG cell wall anchor domain-containing protein [Staphylococcus pasteuri]MCO0861026.1 LPXTG cell wall anchor domain-containing protein [Staphylococcus pasteuri]MCO5360132.1 LPXTG cell wall anchor domain-containing protein [Staphylococcus pasteuri]
MFHQSIKYFISAIVIAIALLLNFNQNVLATTNEDPHKNHISNQKDNTYTFKTTKERHVQQMKLLPETGQNRKHTPLLGLVVLLVLGITFIFIKRTSSKK